MTYQEITIIIENKRRFGKACGRDVMREVLPRFGDPDRGMKIIHIAGTNGKGSTAAFVSSLPGQPELNVLPYHSLGTVKYENIGLTYELDGLEKVSQEKIDICKAICKAEGIAFSIGGANVKKYSKYR